FSLLCWIGGVGIVAGIAGADEMGAGGLGATPYSALFALLTFIGLAVGPIVGARMIHGWSARDILGPFDALRRFAPHALLVALLAMVLTVGGGLMLSELPDNRPLLMWASFLPAGIAGVMLQTLAEEIAFRGYILTALRRMKLPALWAATLSSLLFAAAHFNIESKPLANVLTIANIFIFAMCMCDLTIRSGSIVSAWIMHFCNNAAGILIVSVEGRMSGLSIWVAPESAVTDYSPVNAVFDVTVILIVWFLIRRRIPKIAEPSQSDVF
ncbi:MAG: CPBP family intramembrane glutamic endopeptidase, partial [Deltaproteobacteria bacterium]